MNSSLSDYYPFGMEMPGRDTVFKNGYRYGFNGKEIDNEPYGQGNEYDYGMRIYNPRIGKFLSVDPIESSFSMNSPFSFSENNPIRFIDLDGAEKASPETVDRAKELLNIVGNIISDTKTQLSKTNDQSIKLNLQVKLELDKRTYAAIMVFIYKNNPSIQERMADLALKSEPYVNQALDITPAGDIKVVLTGKNFEDQTKNKVGAVGWLAFDVFGGEILGGLSKASRSLKLLSGPGADALGAVVKKVGNISTALDETHIRAAVNDIFGNPVVINGQTFDHLTEVKNALKGLGNQITDLNKIISNVKNDSKVIESAADLRNTLQRQKDEISAILDRASKSATKK